MLCVKSNFVTVFVCIGTINNIADGTKIILLSVIWR